MVATRMKTGSWKELDQVLEKQTSQRSCASQEKATGKYLYIYILISILFAYLCYHGSQSYQIIRAEQEKQRSEGLQCLSKYKLMDCNPLSQSYECGDMIRCIQEMVDDTDEVKLILSVLSRTSRSVSETLIGPLISILSMFFFYYIKK